MLWRSLRTVIRETARDVLPADIDLDACRVIHHLAGNIEAGATTPAEEALVAVGRIFANYQRAAFVNLSVATDNARDLLMRRAPGIVAMLSDPEYGIAGSERYPPTLAQFTEHADRAEKRVLLAAFGARKGLGFTGPSGR